MNREDYPYCIYCDTKTKWAIFDNIDSILIFYCECGSEVKVGIKLEKDERLL